MHDALDLVETALRRAPAPTDRRGVGDVVKLWRDPPAGPGGGCDVAVHDVGDGRLPAAEWIWPVTDQVAVAPGGLSAFGLAARRVGAAVDAIVADDVALGADGPVFRAKPCFDPVLLQTTDYVGRAVAFRGAALSAQDRAALGAGARPADVIRAWAPGRVAHLPYPVAAFSDAAAPPPPSVEAATGCGHVRIVIPNRNSPELLKRVLSGVLDETDHPDFSVIVVDNGSDDPATLAEYEKRAADPRFRAEIRAAPFNFAEMVNRGVGLGADAGEGGDILLLNNDIEVLSPCWLRRMQSALMETGAGVVGAKLLFPDRTIQHAGVIVGHGGVAGHDLKGAPEDFRDALGRSGARHCRSAVTAAAMLIRADLWDRLGGFDGAAFPVAFNDVDFCLRAWAAGAKVVMAPEVVLIHHEGKSRNKGWSFRRFLRHRRECAALRARHGTVGMIDRFENPWRDHDALTPRYARPAEVHAPRR